MNLAVLRPVLERLLAGPAHPRCSSPVRSAPICAPRFRSSASPTASIGRERGALDAGSTSTSTPTRGRRVTLRRVDRQLNFFHGVAGKFNLDCPVGAAARIRSLRRVAFPNEGRRDAYVAAGIVSAERARADRLSEGRRADSRPCDNRGAGGALGLDPTRPTAIFAPTFSPASALNIAGEAIIETLLGSGCNVIAKLHDRSLDPDPRYTGGINWRERLGAFGGPHFLLAASGDSTPLRARQRRDGHRSQLDRLRVLRRSIVR